MADTPINLHVHEVNAIREGRQTQVRRGLTLRTASFGDRLWVRETWKPHSRYSGIPARAIPQSKIFYAADNQYAPSNTPWKPSIHMPRWASRLTLIVSDVRVQRLQEISRGDAIAEGIERVGGGILRWENWASGIDGVHGFSPEAAFALLWNSINAKRPGCSWDDNPWVVAVTFRAIPKNIDQIGDGDDH